METKNFTPGPWTLSTIPFELRNTDSAAAIYKDTLYGKEVGSALLADISRSPGDQQAEANAKLIAAAPELYEALEKLVESIESDDTKNRGFWAEAGRRALTKATH